MKSEDLLRSRPPPLGQIYFLDPLRISPEIKIWSHTGRGGGLQTLAALKYRTLHEIDAICSDYIYISENKASFKLTEIKELLYFNTFFETLLKLNRVNVWKLCPELFTNCKSLPFDAKLQFYSQMFRIISLKLHVISQKLRLYSQQFR